jgi:hypothetical protein
MVRSPVQRGDGSLIQLLLESRFDLQVALHDELERYLLS